MQFNFLGGPKDVEEFDTKISEVHVWYDHGEFKTWCITKYNAAGDLLGDSEFTHFKSDASSIGKQVAELFDAHLVVYKKNGVPT